MRDPCPPHPARKGPVPPWRPTRTGTTGPKHPGPPKASPTGGAGNPEPPPTCLPWQSEPRRQTWSPPPSRSKRCAPWRKAWKNEHSAGREISPAKTRQKRKRSPGPPKTRGDRPGPRGAKSRPPTHPPKSKPRPRRCLLPRRHRSLGRGKTKPTPPPPRTRQKSQKQIATGNPPRPKAEPATELPATETAPAATHKGRAARLTPKPHASERGIPDRGATPPPPTRPTKPPTPSVPQTGARPLLPKRIVGRARRRPHRRSENHSERAQRAGHRARPKRAKRGQGPRTLNPQGRLADKARPKRSLEYSSASHPPYKKGAYPVVG